MNGQKICILVDSGCDVPQAVRQDYDMRVLPLKIRYPEGEYDDQVNITAQQVYDRFPGEIPQTSLPDGGTIHDALDRARADGYEKALVICISSGLSGTYNMVRLVCQEYQGMETFVLDTRNISFGSGVFAHESTERSFSAVAALYEEAVQVVVRADSGITTLEELQGCTLSVGEEESGTEQNAWQVLAACGLNNRLVHTVNLNYTDAAARLADGTIDAMFVTAGLHADALEQLSKTCAIRLLSVDGGVGARLLAAYPAYRACVIPAGTYAGQGEDVWTVSVQALLLASNALSDETVQRLTARYFDSVDAVAAAVPVPLVTDPAVAAAQSVIPYHTGAAAYYTAQGITPAGPETGASPEQEAAA